jgi:hypothetical protein
LKKYGGPLIMQQRKYDMEQMQDRQQNDLRMGNVAAMQNFNRQPSIGEDDAMLEQEIRSGAYDPETVRALRDDQRAMRQIMRDRNIDGTQRSQALDNLRSRMRMSRSTGKVQPMMQQMPPAAIQGKPPMTEADYFSDPKNYSDSYATAQARLQEGNTPVTPDNVHAQMHNDYLAKQKFLQGLSQPQGQPQPNAPAGPQAPTAPAAAPAGQPQASYSGGQPTFGGSPVMAQGGFSQNGGQQYDPSMVQPIVDAMRTPAATSQAANRNGSAPSFGIALAPGHPDYKAPPTPTNRIDERGYVIMSDGSKVDPRDDFAMSTGGRGQQAVMRLTHPDGSQIERRPDFMMPANYLASNAQGGMGASVGPGAYQPTGSYTSPEVFGAANVLAQQGQQAGQQPSLAGTRKWTSIDGNYTTEGEFQGFAPGLSPDGSQIAMIKRSDTQKVVNVPLDRLSREDSMLLMTGGNRDTQYAMQNPQMSAGQAYFDPNNPVRQEMSAADQSMVNTQKQTLGKPGGRYGLGQIDYGINPATGNRVTASIRPGGTMPEYDEPVGPPGTAMGGRKGSVTIMGGRKKPAAAPEVSPGGTPVDAGIPQARMDRSSPAVQDALKVVADPNASFEQQKAASETLLDAGMTKDDVKKLAPAAPSTEGSYRPSSGDMWGNPNRQPSSEKKSPAWGSQKDVLEIPGQIYGDISAQVKETQKRVGKVMQDRDIDSRQRAKSLMTGLPPLNDQEASDPIGELTETQRKNLRMKSASPPASQSLLGELEQAEPAPAGSVAPPPSPSPITPEQPESPLTAKTTVRTAEAGLFLEKMRKFADQYDPSVAREIMSVYDPAVEDKAKVASVRKLQSMGIDLVEVEKKTKADVLRVMPSSKAPKYPLKPRVFPDKKTKPRIFET